MDPYSMTCEAVLESRLERPNLPRILELYNQSLQLAPDRSLTQETPNENQNLRNLQCIFCILILTY